MKVIVHEHTMKAALALQYGNPNELQIYENVGVPTPSSGMVLVQVIASSLNPVDGNKTHTYIYIHIYTNYYSYYPYFI